MTEARVADPFDLPDWIGAGDTTWTALGSVGEPRITGLLTGETGSDDPWQDAVSLTVLAADVAYPTAALREGVRRQAHQAWVHGEVLLICQNGRYLLAVPGSTLDAGLLCEAIRRFARSLGSGPEHMTVALRL